MYLLANERTDDSLMVAAVLQWSVFVSIQMTAVCWIWRHTRWSGRESGVSLASVVWCLAKSCLSQNPVTNDCVSSQCVTLTNQQYYCHFPSQCFLLVSSVQFPTAMRINSNICVTSVVIQTLYNIWSIWQFFIFNWMFVYIMPNKENGL